MSWTLLSGLAFLLGVALLVALTRRAELKRMRRAVDERDRAVRVGSDKAQFQFPVIDLTRCLGCATCVAVCPEEGVLEIVHGQAVVVNGAHCMGISACERECPVGAITVTLGDTSERDDIPAVSAELEAVDTPGLFLAGEVTAHALIKTAIEHGAAVGAEVARRRKHEPVNGTLDLCIIGAGPAGIACSLEAKRHGLTFVTLDRETDLGGTVATYPRQKLVMTQPVDMPLHGRLKRTVYTKEELIELWQEIAAEHQLPIRQGEIFRSVERDEQGRFVVQTESGRDIVARNVCLAIGRRGIPNKLGVPGEDLQKVAYSLLDAQSYQGRRILIVGGGDSAVETAIGLAAQPGNEVTLSYRRESIFRARKKLSERFDAYVAEGRIRTLLNSEVTAIRPDSVELAVGGRERISLLNDDVFVMAGGTPPFDLLRSSGVGFDASSRPAADPIHAQGTGLIRALSFGLVLTLATLLFALWHSDYYLIPTERQPVHDKHALLRPGMGTGLALGIASTALICLNLLYLVRRSPGNGFRLGSLQVWMTSHIATGILALLCAALHGTMAPRDSAGGHAFWALALLLVTGAIGRYLYSYVPRAANGRELEVAEVKARLGGLSEEFDQGQQKFRERVRTEISALIEKRQWRGSFPGRLLALVGVQRDLRRALARLSEEGREAGVPEDRIRETLVLARRAHRTALMAAHYEDLRALLSSWRFLHRWIAALMVLLLVIHIVQAVFYGGVLAGGATG